MDVKGTITTLLRDGFILVFNQDKLDIIKTAQALIKAGVNNMEVTCRISKPLEKLRRLREELPDFVAGAASLVNYPAMLGIYNKVHSEDPLPCLEEAMDAGACYLVSAINFSASAYESLGGLVPLIPGCGSASEIAEQFSMGANLCKIFPASQLGGAGFVKAIDAPLHKIISLVPTGGTNQGNIPDYIDAGVLVVGGSFSMIEKETMKKIAEEQDYELLARELTAIKHLIDTLRAEKYPDVNFAEASIEEISQATGRDFNIS
ncbi:MAG: bifunctional 4-hydroxy-2-oxoglutarate aldolase/2-dehydro-3-deoxy-phosphogluconate aldolase [Sedimentisphaerales bacterium]|nr:bifunctional 4-hydroxy-2-oxoglutarate aldolase/2-dehydro-3-deoxy-phosphogluconate aldolase [Sedimentisphaerales bacterium]